MFSFKEQLGNFVSRCRRSYHERYLKLYARVVPRIRRLNIEDSLRTLDFIHEHRCSVSRYGDGEFKLMDERLLNSLCPVGFQDYNQALGARLREVVNSKLPEEQLIVCLPRVLYEHGQLNERPAFYWREFFPRFMKEVFPILERRPRYYDAHCTRPYMDYADRRHAQQVYAKWKEIWRGRRLLIVEGLHSRLGVGNDLFDTAQGIRRILVPPTGAFDVYDHIVQSVESHYREGDLVLLAAGPTATVLAYDLARRGMQAIDVGHIDVEYSWYQMKSARKVPLPGKWVNEAGGYVPCPSTDTGQFAASVVDTVGCSLP